MTRPRTIALTLLSAFAALAALPAYAADAESQPAPAKDAESRMPLVVIRFNQPHVSFDNVLRQAVEATNKVRPGAHYDVVSMVPAATDGGQGGKDADANLKAVTDDLKSFGVPSSLIHSETKPSSTAVVQEIDIYVD